jgi:BirA family biotin operon repressor/biotin-[acetyl-CoA-carboxylase] ligase
MTARADAAAIVRLDTVDSTQRHAAALAAAGAADGTVVVAETQTAGRGRRGRVWKDAPGASLLMSIVLRTTLPPRRHPTVSIAAGVAVAEALRAVATLDARLKWPNDVLVGGRKIAGVLLERHGDALVLGIGVNVTPDAIPAELAGQATSITGEGMTPDREALRGAVMDAVAGWKTRLEREGFEPLRARWTALAAMLGRRVTVDELTGTAVGLDGDGALLIQTDHGVTRVVAGDVMEAPQG